MFALRDLLLIVPFDVSSAMPDGRPRRPCVVRRPRRLARTARPAPVPMFSSLALELVDELHGTGAVVVTAPRSDVVRPKQQEVRDRNDCRLCRLASAGQSSAGLVGGDSL